MSFYDRFKLLCEEKGVTPTQAARENGIAQSVVAMWKKRGSTPQSETLWKFVSYFGTNIDFLLEKEGAAMKYSLAPIPRTGTQHKAGDIATDANFSPNILWSDKNGHFHLELTEDELSEIDELNACNLLRACFTHLNIEGKKKVAQYAEDILPRYHVETAPESTPPPSECPSTTPAPDTPETASEGK